MEACKEDKALLLRIFPLEIWLHIFHYIYPEDIQKIFSASVAFEKLLHPIRTKLLFPEILNLLLPFFPKGSSNTDGNKIFLQWRQVCRNWKSRVDQLFQDPRHHIGIENNYLASKHLNLQRLETTISESSDTYEKTPEKFKDHFQATHLASGKNPFIARCLSVSVPCPRVSNKEYDLKLEQMLRQCGHNVWYFALNMNDNTPGGNYPEVRTLLQLVPNIKCLYVSHNTYRATNQYWIPTQLEPFQHIPNLESLHVFENHAKIFDALLINYCETD